MHARALFRAWSGQSLRWLLAHVDCFRLADQLKRCRPLQSQPMFP